MIENWILVRGNLRDFWYVFHKNQLGLLGAFLIVSALFVAIFAPLLTSYGPTEIIRDSDGRGMTFAPPQVHGPLGTDDAGHDIWAH